MKCLLSHQEDESDWLKELRLLYVEDDEGIRGQLLQFLRRRVQEVVTARNGEEGLRLFKEHRPDIVITDLVMPAMNGLEMAEAILAINPHTPIIATVALNETDYLLRAVDLGVAAYIIKPIKTESLVRELLKHTRSLGFAAAFRDSSQLLRLVLSGINEAVFIIDLETQRLGYCNQAAENLFGYNQQEIVGQPANLLHVDQAQFHSFFESAIRAGQATGSYECQGRMLRKNGEVFHSEHLVRPLTDAWGHASSLVSIVRDISLQKKAEDTLQKQQHQANFPPHHDRLTGLVNRLLFMDRLQHALDKAKRLDSKLAVLLLDLDGFKPFNDRYGQELGDKLLQAVAARLSAVTRENDTLGRFGGDEFTVMLENVEEVADRPIIQIVAEKLIRTLAKPFPIDGQSVQITVSIGISLHPGPLLDLNVDAETMIHYADQAMYRAKQGGGNTYFYYEESGNGLSCPVITD